MVAEKIDAFTDAEVALAKALSDGEGIMVAAERAYAPLRRCVGANSSRLVARQFRFSRQRGVSAA